MELCQYPAEISKEIPTISPQSFLENSNTEKQLDSSIEDFYKEIRKSETKSEIGSLFLLTKEKLLDEKKQILEQATVSLSDPVLYSNPAIPSRQPVFRERKSAKKHGVEETAFSFIDTQNLICFLCYRKFNERKMLSSHLTISKFHEANLRSYMELKSFKRNKKTKENPGNANAMEGNVGTKLMEKMGWKSGERLGKEGTGLIEPLQVRNFDKRHKFFPQVLV